MADTERVIQPSRSICRDRLLQTWPFMVVAAAYLILGLGELNRHTRIGEMDTTAYLSGAISIAERGGLLGFLADCVTGSYSEANRHPLYMLLLSFFAVRDLTFFPVAKLFTLFLGLVALGATCWVMSRAFGREAALLAGGLLAMNHAFLNISSMVACETLLVLFFVLTWADAARAIQGSRDALRAGLWAGFAYLTKASGLFLLMSFLGTASIALKHRVLKSRSGWLFVVGFLLVSWPLIARNLIVYRSPFYNVNNAVMWLDRWEDSYSPEFLRNPPSALRFWRSHTIGQILNRLWCGLKGEAKLILAMCWPIFLGRDWGNFFAFLLLLSAAFGFAMDSAPWRRLFTAICILLMFLAFSWYFAIVAHWRFMLPWTPIIFGYAAHGLVFWAKHMFSEERLRGRAHRLVCQVARWCVPGLVACVAVYFGVVQGRAVRNPMNSYILPPGYHELRKWLERELPESATYLMGPTHIYDFHWHSRIRARWLEIPFIEDADKLLEFMRTNRVSALVLDRESLMRRPALREWVISQPREGLHVVQLPEGWQMALIDPSPKKEYLVLKKE